MFLKCEYMIPPIRIAKNAFSSVRKILYIQSKVKEVCEFRTKIPSFYSHLQFAALCFADIQQKKFFICKKVKNILEIGTVSCISLPIKRIVESQLNNSRRGKTERKWFKRNRQKFKLLF